MHACRKAQAPGKDTQLSSEGTVESPNPHIPKTENAPTFSAGAIANLFISLRSPCLPAPRNAGSAHCRLSP